MTFKPAGLATGIGSLPFIESEEALDTIFENLTSIPHWPQLPGRGKAEGMVYQFLNLLVEIGLLVNEGEKTYFNTTDENWVENLTGFYSIFLEAEQGDAEALARFAFSQESATGFYSFINRIEKNGTEKFKYLKGQEVGPLTAGFQLKDAEGRLVYYEDQLRDMVVKALAMHARWQVRKLAQYGLPVIMFVDEPGVGVYGKSTHITVTREMILEDLNAIADAILIENGIPGVHSCDAIDWTLLFESKIEVVSLDVYNFGQSLIPTARELKLYLERGGVMAWGIVPTNESASNENAETLIKRLNDVWFELEKRGVDRDLLVQQSLITPACGAGLLEPKLAKRIYLLTRQVSDILMAE